MSRAQPLAAGAASLLSAALFGLGLVGPLTPSEGCPGSGFVLAFAGVPALLPIAALPVTRASWLRGALLLQATGIVIGAGWLLDAIHCLPPGP